MSVISGVNLGVARRGWQGFGSGKAWRVQYDENGKFQYFSFSNSSISGFFLRKLMSNLMVIKKRLLLKSVHCRITSTLQLQRTIQVMIMIMRSAKILGGEIDMKF
jgi:hypothetical protein